jgi:hypothetical protein
MTDNNTEAETVDKSQLRLTSNRRWSGNVEHPNAADVAYTVARRVKESGLASTLAYGREREIDRIITNPEEIRSCRDIDNLRFERGEHAIELRVSVPYHSRSYKDKVTDSDGNVFVPLEYEISISASSWSAKTCASMMCYTKLVSDVSNIAALLEQEINNGTTVYECYHTKAEVEESRLARRKDLSRKTAEKIVDANRKNFRKGKTVQIRGCDGDLVPDEGTYTFARGGNNEKEFTLRVYSVANISEDRELAKAGHGELIGHLIRSK